MNYLPWHQKNWDLIKRQFEKGRYPHALLLYGAQDLGKRLFAEQLSSLLLCKSPLDNKHCGNCKSCVLRQAGTLSDLRYVSPEESLVIRVDQIRDLNQWIVQTAQQAGNKIAIIYPAEQMNVQAANALLKSLEEPTSGTLFILITDQRSKLIPTIRSRCQSYFFAVPNHAEALAWLKNRHKKAVNLDQLLLESGGRPLAVTRLLDNDCISTRTDVANNVLALLSNKSDALKIAANLQQYQPMEVLRVLESFFAETIKIAVVSDQQNTISQDQEPTITKLLISLGLDQLFNFRDQLLFAIRDLSANSSPNSLLMLESLFVRLKNSKVKPAG
ncbi:MAG: DNA polymerase III subunit delta' [Candidatus Azotimanducaceae bacterium]|uniref:DNA polymerase III subunit delta' n=1 Tax=OM182 bacterium TaxID=2510334 RepID=A0A520RYC4_9GAMM|nr:DNA polymerase III subunit delta' [Gammaproteobacteria bacterium]RZO75219.1 MAG: DNA polymerase III subunit delta' [OM182 bacterium]